MDKRVRIALVAAAVSMQTSVYAESTPDWLKDRLRPFPLEWVPFFTPPFENTRPFREGLEKVPQVQLQQKPLGQLQKAPWEQVQQTPRENAVVRSTRVTPRFPISLRTTLSLITTKVGDPYDEERVDFDTILLNEQDEYRGRVRAARTVSPDGKFVDLVFSSESEGQHLLLDNSVDTKQGGSGLFE